MCETGSGHVFAALLSKKRIRDSQTTTTYMKVCVYDSCPLMKDYSKIYFNLNFEHMEQKPGLKLLQYVAQMRDQTETGGQVDALSSLLKGRSAVASGCV